jgi:hypothetical protein
MQASTTSINNHFFAFVSAATVASAAAMRSASTGRKATPMPVIIE